MTSLGNFGVERPAHEADFGYFGKTVRVHPDLSDLALIEFMESAVAIESMGAGEAMGSVSKMLRSLVHPEDFDVFWKAARANRQTIEDLTTLAEALIESVADRPTVRPSGSSDGPLSTGASSPVVSSSPVVRDLEAKGRPDLALVVVQTQEHLAAQVSA